MFKNTKAFSSFSVNDTQKAKAFYGETLGLDVREPAGMGGILEVRVEGANPIILYPKKDHQPATFTVLNFPVADVEYFVDRLTGKGIRFEQYKREDIKTDAKGIAREKDMAIAWFKDPAGNILSVVTHRQVDREDEEVDFVEVGESGEMGDVGEGPAMSR